MCQYINDSVQTSTSFFIFYLFFKIFKIITCIQSHIIKFFDCFATVITVIFECCDKHLTACIKSSLWITVAMSSFPK